MGHKACSWTARGLDGVLAVVLAPACGICATVLERPTAGPVCERCWGAIRPFTPPCCTRCGLPLASRRGGTRCRRCRTRRSPVRAARAVGAYDGALRAILHLFKYGRRPTLAAGLAALMRRDGTAVLRDADFVIPVPLHRRRRRVRGFNQAAALARRLDRPVLHALRRVRATPPQTRVPARRRRQNVRRAFGLAGTPTLARTRRRLRGARVVLIDDVATTGATLEACGRVLRAGGAAEVRALTLTKAVRRHTP